MKRLGYSAMKQRLNLSGALLFIIIHILWSPTAQGSNGKLHSSVILVESGLLTVSIKDISLVNFLDELANQTGIVFDVYANTDRKVTGHYSKIPLDEGLKRLLSPSNFIIIYMDKNDLSKKTEIKKIIVYDHFGDPSGQRTIKQTTQSDVGKEGRKTGEKRNKTDAAKSLEAYAEQLKDVDPDIRADTVSDMADEYGQAALIYLEKALVFDGNDDVRAAAAEEIGGLDNEEGIEILAKGLNDPDEDVREAVMEALGEIGGQKALPVLRKALKDKNEDIREAAADLIEEIEDEIKSE